ncbi:KilA-N domain-containing protein [Terrihabitans sp. B22-R8]|uniref:KilA-N domain-containing protein n=1 Tax=Terrihabitans sp. B22-R8 TaxID=3425128 RepID=UPI00403CCC93
MSGANQLIVLDGSRVPLKGEMVSLTGLWKAAGSDPSKQPAKWRELPSTKEFVAHVADLILQKSENEIFSVTRGGKSPSTYAHWQIAMSYARYLDPAFAVRCNEVVRAHMEQQTAVPSAGISEELLEAITRTYGIVRMLAGKVTKIEKTLTGPVAALAIEQKNGPESAPTLPSRGSNPSRQRKA